MSAVTKDLISVAHLAATAGVITKLNASEAVLHIPDGIEHGVLVVKRIQNLYVFDCIYIYMELEL